MAPTHFVPCVVEREGKRILEAYRWGLVPWFSKNLSIAYKTINARAEGRQLVRENKVL
ncbi:SOS response-associated peptidase family protein [Paenibacillus sp. R14(2021)]|uniref:SOS response-associated peptidase family protein n=1 Tax=Paenibacillus sp. R14(2021) TaxID=2859228 RepID=UPI001C6163C8|nr:SOS response-associated peptidase family protein [Paenibacillus sp. R14(2021)]